MVRPSHRTVPEEEDADEGDCPRQGEGVREEVQHRVAGDEHQIVSLTRLTSYTPPLDATVDAVCLGRQPVRVLMRISLADCPARQEELEAFQCRQCLCAVAESFLLPCID